MQDDVEIVALREELARLLANKIDGCRPRVLHRQVADAILPIIARERAATLSAATPGIEARVRETMLDHMLSIACEPVIVAFLRGCQDAAIRKGRP